jgi:hypothetical protein
VFPFLKYELMESNDGTEVTASFSVIRLDGFSAESSNEVIVAFKEDSARFLRIPLESEKKFMSFGYDSLIQLFVFLVSFFSVYLGITVKQVLNFFFQKEMDWKEFLMFVLDSNLIDSTVDHGAVFVYGIGVLEFRKKTFSWTDMHYNQFSYEISTDVEALFVISFVLGYIQSVLGHDLLVSNLIEPDEATEDQNQPEGEAGGQGEAPEGGMDDLGGMGGGMGGGPGGASGGGPGDPAGGLGGEDFPDLPGSSVDEDWLSGSGTEGLPPEGGAGGAPEEAQDEEEIPVPGALK